ncbi:MAG: hypothetical protein ACO3F5_07410, partial [Gemmatimonadaceae bacterium]
MIPALDKAIPVVVAANSVSQINDAITWAKAEGIRLVIRGGRAPHLSPPVGGRRRGRLRAPG